MFFPIVLETIHLPLHIYLFATDRLHPITALVLSIFLIANWITLSIYGILFNWCAERQFPVAWESLFWARQALGYLLAVIYLVYMGYAAAAVHHWRKVRKGRISSSSDLVPLTEGGKESIRDGKIDSS